MPTARHSRLFLPISCFLKDENYEHADFGYEQENEYSTKYRGRSHSLCLPRENLYAASTPKNMTSEVIRQKNEQESNLKLISDQRRNKQLQIKRELKIGELEGFDDTMLDVEKQKQILEEIKQSKAHQADQKQAQLPAQTYPDPQQSLTNYPTPVQSLPFMQQMRYSSQKAVTQPGFKDLDRHESFVQQTGKQMTDKFYCNTCGTTALIQMYIQLIKSCLMNKFITLVHFSVFLLVCF